MSLYASKKAVEMTINVFTQLHECSACGRYFTELENIGCWDCKYHPGEFDYTMGCYTCCGDSPKEPSFHYRSFNHLMTWKGKDKWNRLKLLSDGCCRCDCKPKVDNAVPTDVMMVDDIATLIPFMKRDIKLRPGLKKGPLRIERKEDRPYALWEKPPHT